MRQLLDAQPQTPFAKAEGVLHRDLWRAFVGVPCFLAECREIPMTAHAGGVHEPAEAAKQSRVEWKIAILEIAAVALVFVVASLLSGGHLKVAVPVILVGALLVFWFFAWMRRRIIQEPLDLAD